MMPPTIGDYFRAAIDGAQNEINSAADDRVLGLDLEQWIDYLMAKWGMVTIEFDESRQVEMVETEREYRQRGYDIMTDRAPGTLIRQGAVRIEIPVQPSDTLQVIADKHLAPNSFSISYAYPPFEYDHRRGILSAIASPDAGAVKSAIDRVKSDVRGYNESIQSENQRFRPQVAQMVNTKRSRVLEKHKGLDSLSAAVGIPLRKKAEIATVVPTAPKVRAAIRPVLPPPSRPPTRPVLEPDKFAAILELIDNSGRQFERTPQSFQQLTEEGLRDILLSSLNAVFEGAAGGETFQGVGKVDIHLRISQGEVFLAELKFWEGPESLKFVIRQLLGRLTWRDSYGVAIVLSRNAGFTDVLHSIREAIPTGDGFVGGTLQDRAPNHFVARFSIPSDGPRTATVHVLAYNLYVAETGRRVAKRAVRPNN